MLSGKRQNVLKIESSFICMTLDEYRIHGKHSYLSIYNRNLYDSSRSLQFASKYSAPYEIGYGISGSGSSLHMHKHFTDLIMFPGGNGRIRYEKSKDGLKSCEVAIIPPECPFVIDSDCDYYFLKFIAKKNFQKEIDINDEKIGIGELNEECVKRDMIRFDVSGSRYYKETITNWYGNVHYTINVKSIKNNEFRTVRSDSTHTIIFGKEGAEVGINNDVVNGPFVMMSKRRVMYKLRGEFFIIKVERGGDVR